MSLMEAGLGKIGDAQNAAGAMVNRAMKEGVPLGEHVSQKIYQPTIEPSQEARLGKIVASPQFKTMTEWVGMRSRGEVGDPVSGATHFLAHPQVMLALEAKEPSKYKNWGPRGANWTGYDEATGQYKNQVYADGSHAFLAPEGAASGSARAPAPAQPSTVIAEAPKASATQDTVASVTEPRAQGRDTGMLGPLLALLSQSGDVASSGATAAPAPAAPSLANIAGDAVAGVTGSQEAGGMLTKMLSGGNANSASMADSALSSAVGSAQGATQGDVGQNAMLQAAAMNQKALSSLQGGAPRAVDMRRIVELLQNRNALGV